MIKQRKEKLEKNAKCCSYKTQQLHVNDIHTVAEAFEYIANILNVFFLAKGKGSFWFLIIFCKTKIWDYFSVKLKPNCAGKLSSNTEVFFYSLEQRRETVFSSDISIQFLPIGLHISSLQLLKHEDNMFMVIIPLIFTTCRFEYVLTFIQGQ